MEYPPSGSPKPCFHRVRMRTKVIGSPTRNRFSSGSGVQSGRERTPRSRRKRGSEPFLAGGFWFIIICTWLSMVRVLLPNDHHQRGEPAAKGSRIAAELNGWLPSPEAIGLEAGRGFPTRSAERR